MYINDAEECGRDLMKWMGAFTVCIGKMDNSNLQYLHYKIVRLHYRRYFVAQNDEPCDEKWPWPSDHAFSGSPGGSAPFPSVWPSSFTTNAGSWSYEGTLAVLWREKPTTSWVYAAFLTRHSHLHHPLPLYPHTSSAVMCVNCTPHRPPRSASTMDSFLFRSYSSVTNTVNGKVNEAKLYFVWFLFFIVDCLVDLSIFFSSKN